MRVCQEPLGTFRGASAAMRRHRDGTRSPSQPDASCASRATAGSWSAVRGSIRASEGAGAPIFELGTLINWRSPLAIAFLSVGYLILSKGTNYGRPCSKSRLDFYPPTPPTPARCLVQECPVLLLFGWEAEQ